MTRTSAQQRWQAKPHIQDVDTAVFNGRLAGQLAAMTDGLRERYRYGEQLEQLQSRHNLREKILGAEAVSAYGRAFRAAYAEEVRQRYALYLIPAQQPELAREAQQLTERFQQQQSAYNAQLLSEGLAYLIGHGRR